MIRRVTVVIVILMTCALAFPAAAHLADTPWPMFHHDLNHTGFSTYHGPDTSTVKWIFSTGDRIDGSAVIGDDGTIYVRTHDQCLWTESRLYAIYPNGIEKWHWTPPSYKNINFIDSTPAVASDGTIYVGCRDRYLYALYPNGTQKWEFYAPQWWGHKGFVLTSPAIGPDGTIYVGNNNYKLYAINPDGTEKWSYDTKGAIRSSPAIGADGTIYVGSHDKKLYAVNPDGTLKWKYTTGSWIVSSPAIGADGTIYVGSNDKKLHAINPDGTQEWTYTTGCYVQSSPAIDADGTIYVGSYDAKLYAINPDGSLLWEYSTGDLISYSSPAIASDGTVYIGNWGGNLYAFGPGVQSNRPPVLDPVGDRTVNETETLPINLDATDPDGDPLHYSCNRNDLFTDFNQVTGTGNWTTTYDDAGIYWADFGVSDSSGNIANETIRIEVLDVNRPPVLDPVGNRSVNENSLLEFTINASDPDGDILTYSASNLPDGAVFDPGTRGFSWTPSFDQAGTYSEVCFEVSDGELTDHENITIVVDDINRPPVLDQIGDKTTDENSLLEFTINASDPDEDILIYSASNLPDGAVFNSTTQTFSWTPAFDQAGIYPDVHFEVNDGELTDWESITIVVNNTNRPPVLDPIGDKTVSENSLIEFAINATDPDGDALAYLASNLPDGAVFDPHTQTFSWTPSFDQAGMYPDVHFEVSDGELTDRVNITIVVNNTDRSPVLDPIGDKTTDENSLLEFTINASDPDGDMLAYSASNLPAGAVFNSTTQTFSWSPSFDQAGTYPDVYFEVDDGELTDHENITIVVNNKNRAPVLDPIGDKVTDENSFLEFTVNATDPDGDVLAYSASNLPAGAVFNSTTQTFSWTPAFGQAGTYHDVHFEVSDGELICSENITIVVTEVAAPKIGVIVPGSEVIFQQQFTVNITVDPMTAEIYGVQYTLNFNNSVLHAEWQNEGTFLNQDGSDTQVYINTINNGAGTISFAATRIGTEEGVSTPGTLAVIKFTAILKGECTDLNLIDVVVSNENGEEIDPIDITNSSVCVDENQPPVAVGKSMHRYNNEGEKYLCKVYFDGTDSYDPDGEIIYWRWSFGDGNYGTGELTNHVYHSWRWNGTGYDPFTAILTVNDDGDPHELDDSASFDVMVYTAGDTNGDGEIDILDATIVGLEWDHVANFNGNLYWYDNPRGDMADLNNDRIVDILDAVIVGTCWGHTAW